MKTNEKSAGPWIRWGFAALLTLPAATLVWGVMNLPGQGGLARQVRAKMEMSGVIHPVTAVLLNFRGYDTLLEIGVLLLAVLGVYSLRKPGAPLSGFPPSPPILFALTRLLVPLTVLVGGYLCWSGAYAPGGAFQAGAVIGAGGVLLVLNGVDLPGRKKEWPLRLLLLLGFGLFLGVGAGLMAAGYRLLEYPSDMAGTLIVLIEGTLSLSIAFVLAELFASSSSEGTPPGIIPNMGKEET